jgi:hypothetical protein
MLDIKLKLRVLRDLNPRAQKKLKSKLQTRPPVREGTHDMKITNVRQQ